MKSRRRLRRLLSNIARSLLLMVIGAEGLLAYLRWSGPASPQIERIQPIISGAFWVLFWTYTFATPQRERAPSPPSPRWSGMTVVLFTGFVATLYLGGGSLSGGNPVAALLVAIGTIIAAALVWRFATAHAGEIGEARFDTSGAQMPRG